MGWIESSRKSYTGIGKTLEDLLKKKEDNLPLPDFEDIEIKSRDKISSSLITLFTKSPSYPRGANTLLADEYGYYEYFENGEKYPYKSFFATVSGKNPLVSAKMNLQISLEIDYTHKKIFLILKDIKGKKTIDNKVYWDFSVIEDTLDKKLKYLCIVSAHKRRNNEGKIEYNYDDFVLIYDFNIDGFLKGIENGEIFIDTRVGLKKKDMRRHDHGTAFRISYKSIEKYGKKYIID